MGNGQQPQNFTRLGFRWLAPLAVLSLLLIALFGATRRTQEQADTPASPIKTWAGKTLLFVTPSPHARSGEAAARWFEEETGAVVQIKVINYDEIAAVIEKDHASGAPRYDVFLVFYADLVPLISQGIVLELTRYIEQHKDVIRPEDFIPGFYDNYSLYQDKRWALPLDGDTHVLFYRKSLLAKYGLKPPETWDEYLHVARTLTEKERANGIYGTAIMASPAPILIVSSYLNRLASFGGELLDSAGSPAVSSPEAVLALEAMIEHAKYALPTPLETDFDASRSAFLSGRAAMAEQWTDIGIMAEDATQSSVQGDWGVVPMPRGSGPKARSASALNGGFCVAAARSTREPELAKAFIQFITRPDIMLRLNLINGGMDPARLSTLHSPEFQRFTPEISRVKALSLLQTVPWPRVPQTPRLMEVLSRNLVKALEGQLTAEEALKETDAQWRAILRPENEPP
jgi:multiple sugar transport system substrate-binding protein